MAEVPMSMTELEEIALNVGRDLLEDITIEFGINDEDVEEWTKLSARIAVFCIDRYMTYVNEAISKKMINEEPAWKITDLP